MLTQGNARRDALSEIDPGLLARVRAAGHIPLFDRTAWTADVTTL